MLTGLAFQHPDALCQTGIGDSNANSYLGAGFAASTLYELEPEPSLHAEVTRGHAVVEG